MRRRGRFHKFRRRRSRVRIPGESMADIAFLLMVFFMTTTVLQTDQGPRLDLPRALSAMVQPRAQITHVYLDAQGRTTVDDFAVRGGGELARILGRKLQENPGLIVALNCDARTPYHFVHAALAELKRAEAVRVSFTAEPDAPEGPAGSLRP